MIQNDEVLGFPKKKKKKPINLDEILSRDPEESEMKETPLEDQPAEDGGEELNLSIKKKKKKKKIAFSLAGQNDQSIDANGEHPTTAGETDGALLDVSKTKNVSQQSPGELEAEAEEDLDDLGIDKKKKKKRAVASDDSKRVAFLDTTEENDGLPVCVERGQQSWSGSDRDYIYDELLTRVFDIMRQKNPEMVAGEKKRFVMKPPQCARVGTKKTSFVNFTEICAVLHRQPKHTLAFILAELGTSGSVDGNNQLIIKGRFQQKQLESVLRRYIKEYVTCHTCRSPDTILERDVRLHFLRCRVCQSRCSVATIKSGFQAVTGKRARMRAKAMS